MPFMQVSMTQYDTVKLRWLNRKGCGEKKRYQQADQLCQSVCVIEMLFKHHLCTPQPEASPFESTAYSVCQKTLSLSRYIFQLYTHAPSSLYFILYQTNAHTQEVGSTFNQVPLYVLYLSISFLYATSDFILQFQLLITFQITITVR